nr:MAG TPA: RNA dependent RNA polymerase [Bacteriophage sp.]
MENLITIKSVNAVRSLVKGKDMYAFCSEPLDSVKARGIYEPFSYLELHLASTDEKEVFINFSCKTVLSTVNRESPFLESSVKTDCVVTGNNDMRLRSIIPRFNDAYISITCATQSGLEYIAKRPVYKYNGSFYILNKENYLVSCFTGVVLDEAKTKYVLSKALQYGYDALDYSNEDMYLYCDAISSAGNLKQNKIILYCVNHPTFDIKLFNEKCLYGMYKHLKRDVGFNMADNKKKWSQASTRLAQIKAFMAECAVSNCYAIFFGKFSCKTNVEDEDLEFADGHGYYNSKELTKQINNRINPLHFKVEENTILGMGLQARPLSAKCFWLAVPEVAINHYINSFEVEHYFVETDGDKSREEFIKALCKNKDSKFWGKVVIVHTSGFNPEEPVCWFTDMNGMKAPFNPEAKAHTNILEMSHEDEEDMRNASTQLYKTLKLASPDEARELFLDRIRETVKDKKRKLLGDLTDEEKSRIKVSAGDLLGDRMSVLQTLRPDIVNNELANSYRNSVDNLLEGLSRDVYKASFKVEGFYGFMIPELSLLFCKERLLQVNEIYIGKNKVNKKVAITKYPKMGNHEFGIYIAISYYEYLERAKKVMSKGAFMCFKKLLLALEDGLVICPAYGIVLNLHAGSDFDGDKMFIITDEKVIAIMEKTQSIATVCL